MIRHLNKSDKQEKKKLRQSAENSLKGLRVADVELFVSAAQMKSLGKSALFHHLSQSGASAAIKRVEEAFGRVLCTHVKGLFVLLLKGKTFFQAWKIGLSNYIQCFWLKKRSPFV